jgi:AcrR family transcriptional regulator
MTHDTPKPNKRDLLLAAAERVFGSQGFERATVDMVATEAGVAKGSVYNYFDSKSDLFMAVYIEKAPDDREELSERLVTCNSAAEKISLVLDWWYARHAEASKLKPLLLEFWISAVRQEDGTMLNAVKERYLFWRKLLTEILNEGIAAGEFHGQQPAENSAAVLMAMLDGLVLQNVMDVGINIDDSFFSHFKQAILVSLSSRIPSIAQAETQPVTDEYHE